MSPIAAAKLLVLLMGEPRVADPQRLADRAVKRGEAIVNTL